ncbi:MULTISPECIES: sugar ABC transporter substrate-binding protein [unclassified Nocardioides]|uniref:sugar ABC transporter substrate-binding protein n=1 Tax=unclassified Nocardioides TaxID=2615069 RepID=UPI003612846F
MRLRRAAAASLALIAALGLAACNRDGGGSGSDPNAMRIGVSFYTKTIPMYVEMEKGMREEADELGVELEFAYADNSAETQSNQINTFVTKGVDLILASPVDAEALVPAYQQARAADIPVISVGNKVDDAEEDAYVGPSLVALSQQTMENTIEGMGGKGDLLLITGPPQIAFVQLQKQGWDAALAEHPEVNVVDTLVVPDMTTGAAVDIANSGFASAPDVDAVLSSLDDIALGALQAAQGRNMDLDKVFFAGWDGGPAALDAVESGDYDMTLSMRAQTWGTIAVQTGADWVDGTEPDGHYVDTPSVFITPDNITTLSVEDRS